MKNQVSHMGNVQGSYTVEAAIIVPIVLVCILLVLSKAISLYEEVTDITVFNEWWQELEPEEIFRENEVIKQ